MPISTLIHALLPVYLIFALGVAFRKAGILNRDEAAVLLKVVFYICLPALMAYSMSNVRLSRAYAVLPCIAPGIVFVTFGVSWLTCYALKLPAPTRGTFFVGTLVMNVAFMYPIVHGLYGVEGLSRLTMFDAGQGVMAFSFAYFLACWYSDRTGSGHTSEVLRNVLKSPPLWAITIAITLNLLSVPLPDTLQKTLLFLGNGTTPLIMLSMGILFTPAVNNLHVMLAALVIRMIGGSLLGLLFATLFHQEGEMRTIIILGAAAPVGQSTLTFSALKRLDMELAGSLVPVSVLIGIVYIPILLLLFQ